MCLPSVHKPKRQRKTERRRGFPQRTICKLALASGESPHALTPLWSCSLASSLAALQHRWASCRAWATLRTPLSTRTWRPCWKPHPPPWRTLPQCWACGHAAEQAEVTLGWAGRVFLGSHSAGVYLVLLSGYSLLSSGKWLLRAINSLALPMLM